MIQHQSSWLIRVVAKLLKYYLLSGFGYGVFYLLLKLLNLSQALGILLSLGIWFWKVGVVVFCLIVIVVFTASLNS